MDIQVIQSYLRQFPLLSSLTSEEFSALARKAEVKHCSKHGYIYLADEKSEYVGLLIRGTVKTGIHHNDGREVIKLIVHALAIFGELGLSGETHRSEFAAALNQEVTYLQLPVAELKQIMLHNPAFMLDVIKHFGERVQRAERQWESLILKDVRSRIVEFLKDSANDRGKQVGYETLVKHSLTQQDIANLVGASRQTVTAILNDLRKSNMIYFTRTSILIRDMDKLN